MSHVTVSFRAPALSAALMVLVAASAATAQWQTGAESSSSSASSSQAAPAISGDSGTVKEAEAAVAPVAPVKKLSPRRERLFREQAAAGNSLYTIGSVSSWVGLGAFWTGFFTNQGLVSNLGMLAMWGGIPMMGVGAGQVQNAALAIDPEVGRAGAMGWPLYGAGIASQVAAFVVIGVNLKEDESGDLTIAPAAALTGLGLLAAGQIMHYVSWYQFSRRRSLGNINLASWSLHPEVHLAANGAALPGARLTYRF